MNQIIQFPDLNSLTDYAANRLLTLSQTAVQQNGRFLLALSGGSTPKPLHQKLTQSPFSTQIPWAQTHIFWGDERIVPHTEPGSNYGQAKKELFDQLPTQPHLYPISGTLSPKKAAAAYQQQLQQLAEPTMNWPRFDCIFLGLGSDGHTASLFPGQNKQWEATAVPVTANYDGRPAHRVTLTPAVLNSARLIIFLVSGKNKANALSQTINAPFNPLKQPAQTIHPYHGKLLWLVTTDTIK